MTPLCPPSCLLCPYLIKLALGLFCFWMLFLFFCPYVPDQKGNNFFLINQSILDFGSFNCLFKHRAYVNILGTPIDTIYGCHLGLFLPIIILVFYLSVSNFEFPLNPGVQFLLSSLTAFGIIQFLFKCSQHCMNVII